MEETILPALASLRPTRMLDIGVREYTRHYGKWAAEGCERWTIDADPAVVGFGSPGLHVVGSVLDMTRHFENGSFDVILMNGIFGHGVDHRDDQERALMEARALLRDGGRLVIGWDRQPDGTPFVLNDESLSGPRISDPLEIELMQSRFRHVAPCGLPPRKEFANSWHLYDWFVAC